MPNWGPLTATVMATRRAAHRGRHALTADLMEEPGTVGTCAGMALGSCRNVLDPDRPSCRSEWDMRRSRRLQMAV